MLIYRNKNMTEVDIPDDMNIMSLVDCSGKLSSLKNVKELTLVSCNVDELLIPSDS